MTYSVENGLSDNTVYSIFQDNRGFLWVSTYNGLNRFDGYDFTVFSSESYNQNSIGEGVTAMYQTKNGTLWIGTQSVLQYYDATKNNFKTFPFFNKYNTRVNIHVTGMVEDDNGVLWIGTYNYGLLKFNPQTSKYSSFADSVENAKYPFPSRKITCMLRQGNYLWIGTEDIGLIRFNINKRRFTIFNTNSGIVNNHVRSLVWDRLRECLWIGTDGGLCVIDNENDARTVAHPTLLSAHPITSAICVGRTLYLGTRLGGLKVYNPDDNTCSVYTFNQLNNNGLPDNFISSLFCDKQGNVWIGTNEGGLAFVSGVKNYFRNYQLSGSITDVRQNFVISLYCDNLQNIWAGSDGDGMFVKHPSVDSFVRVSVPALKNAIITDIAKDSKKCLWVTTSGNGVYILKNNQVEQHIDRFTPKGNNLSSNTINKILVTQDGNVWLGSENDGIDIWNEREKHFYPFSTVDSKAKLSCNQITALLQDSKGAIWIGTTYGLNYYHKDSGGVRHYFHNRNDSLSLSNDYITSLFEDRNGNVWIGTKYGLNKFNNGSNGSFINFFSSDSLVDNTIQCIEADEKGNLWISTNKGISFFNLKQWRFYNYNDKDGLQANRFKGAGCRSANGTVYLGGENGITAIHSQKLQHNNSIPVVYFSHFEVFNQTIVANDATNILQNDISQTSKIELSYTQNMISIGFTAINFVNADKTSFAYKLEGVDNDWIVVDSKQRIARYAHLAPGTYIFKVKACNSDRLWNTKAATLEIEIVPPFWKTVYFFIIVVIFVVGFVIVTVQIREYRLVRSKKKLEQIVRQRTLEIQRKNEELELLNRTKDKLFSIIAHDLKNPLNALLGFTELMTTKYDVLDDSQKTRFIGIINNSAKHMYDMLINLLNWSRSQLGAINPRQTKVKVAVNFEANIALSGQMIENKQQTVQIDVEPNCIAWADSTLFDTVVRNLLSNAIKYTPENGKIILAAKKISETTIEVSITDTGVGMSKEILDGLFQIDQYRSQPGTNREQGTGLGLIVCKEFVEKNGGQLSVESELNTGSVFRFTVPAFISNQELNTNA